MKLANYTMLAALIVLAPQITPWIAWVGGIALIGLSIHCAKKDY